MYVIALCSFSSPHCLPFFPLHLLQALLLLPKYSLSRDIWKAGIGWSGLSDGETTAPWKLNVYCIELNREAGLLHTAECRGGVCGVQLDQGDSVSSLYMEQSLGCKYRGRKSYGGQFLHTQSTSTHRPEGKALPFPSGPHPSGRESLPFPMSLRRLWGP